MTEPMLLSDARVAAVPVRDCAEPLVDLRACTAVRVDLRKQDPAGAFAHVRQGLRRRLERAAELLPQGLQVLMIEGYRPPELQLQYFADYRHELRQLNRDWPDDEIHAAASRYVAPPDVAPHPTGGAIDVTLSTTAGEELDLGTRVNASPEESHGACYTDASWVPAAARRHRAVLAEALGTVGFVNYPTEWWHWSVGDRYWAAVTGAPAAFYGPVRRPDGSAAT
ncbi:dipeptidase [Geodermatophilus sp. DF01-2]|uniref:M15 family metallopeptidase n=1 Tax=Geodermatophilus sp. DF01-2 TaxID=2559610 RepID=UPI001072FDCC|nr:M15 family metallopeptidase [Geodermatophilus sp. DF01_2]TFV63931.1 dipeptidase [Geodermatophilus sp. DF01_2]